ncbi:MAG: citrate/2-methylcitrate synthase [Candidatus Bipolaricaulia bacterium]
MTDGKQRQNAVEAVKGLEGVIIGESELSYIDGQQGVLAYLGIPIEELAEASTFEEVAYMLLHHRPPNRDELEGFKAELTANRALPGEVLQVLKDLHVQNTKTPAMAVLRTAISALGVYDPEAEDHSPEAIRRKAVRLIARSPTIVAAIQRLRRRQEPVAPNSELGHAANFLYMLTGTLPDDYTARVMDVALILHADHGSNASTFTAIVTISTLTDIYSAVTAAVGSLKGPLHGGANREVMQTLLQIGDVEKAETYVEEALAHHQKIMGFGHRVYKTYDPRARILNRYSKRLAEIQGDITWYEISRRIEKAVVDRLGEKGIFPNVDFYSATVYYYMGFEPDLYTPIFAVSRIAGWTAHILEQLEENRLFRPRFRYIGPIQASYIPIDER